MSARSGAEHHDPLGDGFESKWEQYLRDQWNAFFPSRSFEELNRYYPISRAREQIAASASKSAGG